MAIRVLVVDDQADIRTLLSEFLEDEGYIVYAAGDSEEALKLIELHRPRIVLLDIWLNDKRFDGIAILDIIQRKYPGIVTIMMSGHGTIETAVSSLKKGAFDFIEKPFQSEKLSNLLDKASQIVQLSEELDSLRDKVIKKAELIGSSKVMESIQKEIESVVRGQSRVMIVGESGVGKTHVAEYIHFHSNRATKPLISVDCSALDETTFQEDFFGSESKDANQYPVVKIGVLERVNGGTLLLENVGDLPKSVHAQMAHLLQTKKFSRVGSDKSIDLDVRILSTLLTPSGTPNASAYHGGLREDLYHRLAITKIELPVLKDRLEDIDALVAHFLSKLKSRKNPIKLSVEAKYQLLKCVWPGNIRQLNNALESALIKMSENDRDIKPTHLPQDLNNQENVAEKASTDDLFVGNLREARERFERAYIDFQIKCCQGNIKKTADAIGMERTALHRKMKSLGLFEENEDN